MSLKKFETFIRRLSRLLYDDDLTPILIDYLLKHQMCEANTLKHIFRL